MNWWYVFKQWLHIGHFILWAVYISGAARHVSEAADVLVFSQTDSLPRSVIMAVSEMQNPRIILTHHKLCDVTKLYFAPFFCSRSLCDALQDRIHGYKISILHLMNFEWINLTCLSDRKGIFIRCVNCLGVSEGALDIIIIMKADTNNHINGGKHYRWTERHIALTTAQH